MVGEIALLFGEAAQMETTYRRVVGIILVPQQPVGGELEEIVGVDRVGAFPSLVSSASPSCARSSVSNTPTFAPSMTKWMSV